MRTHSLYQYPYPPSFVPLGLRLGLGLVGLGVLVFGAGHQSLAHPVMAVLLALGALAVGWGLKRWANPSPPWGRAWGWADTAMAAVVMWVPLVLLYRWRLEAIAQMGPNWSAVVVMAPAYEIVVSKFLIIFVLASAQSGVMMGLLSLLLMPWRARPRVARARAALGRVATVCLGATFVAFLVWVGRGAAVMGLAG